jgi:hypothetical protein
MEWLQMPIVRLQIDVSGTRGEEVWRNLRHFDLVDGAPTESHPESGERCKHPADAVHPEGEFLSATIQVETMLLAQYAVAHYLEQNHVLDADVSGDTESVLSCTIPHVS